MAYIIVLVLVIAIIVVAVRQQKINAKREERLAEEQKQAAYLRQEKENSIDVDDYIEVDSESN
ncbi:MAG: hypothetical protein IJ168_11775 [Eubacterium sp.]|nr:hypothetical protein [Eubacterium sp.]